MAILPAKPPLGTGPRHARVYSLEPARTKPPSASCLSTRPPRDSLVPVGRLVFFVCEDGVDPHCEAAHTDVMARHGEAAIDAHARATALGSSPNRWGDRRWP